MVSEDENNRASFWSETAILLITPYIASKAWQGGQAPRFGILLPGSKFHFTAHQLSKSVYISPIKWDNNYLSLAGIVQGLNVIAKQST